LYIGLTVKLGVGQREWSIKYKMKTVHLLRNEWSKWIMHQLLLDIGLHYRDECNYELKIYNSKNPVEIKIGKHNYIIADTDIVIYDEDNDTLKAICHSYRKRANGNLGLFDIFKKRNNKNDILLVRNYYYWGVEKERSPDWNFKIEPTIFYGFNPEANYYYWHSKRRLIKHEDLIDKMWFKGLIFRGDEKILSEKGYTNPYGSPTLNHSQYLNEAIKYKIGLSIPGTCELCHRDFEYMAIGLPILKFEFAGNYIPEIKPNYHYISIDRDENFPADHLFDQRGGEKYVKKYISKFDEVKNDKEFLSFISKNAHEYYKAYCSPENMLSSILKQLNN